MTTTLGPFLDKLNLPLLTPEEERELSRRARVGREAKDRIERGLASSPDRDLREEGRAAHAELFARNLRLVVSVAKRYPVSARVELADLIQEGCVAMDHAIDKFDERLGFRLSTYAVKWIRQALSRLLDKQSSTAAMPIETARQVRAALRDSGGEAGDLSPALYEASLAWAGASLDAAVGLSGSAMLGDFGSMLATPSFEAETVNRIWGRELTAALLERLDPLSRCVVVRRFGLEGAAPASIAAIAAELRVGRKKVRSLLNAAGDEMAAGDHPMHGRHDSDA